MNLFKKFWLRKATNDVVPSVTAGEEVLPRPASMAFVPSKDVVARAIDLSHTISDYDLLKRTLGQEFGLNDEEVTQVLGAVIPQMVGDEESTTVTSETERNPVNNPAEADERPLDNPQSTEEHKPLSKSIIESLYYEGYDNREIAKTLKVSQAVIDDYVSNNLEPIIRKMQSLAKDHLVHDIKDELRSARHYMSLAEQDSEHAKEFMDIASDEVEHQHKLREIENEEEQKEAFQAAASKKGGALDTTMPIKKSNTNSFKKLWGAITNFGQWGGYRQRKVLENPTNFKKHWMLTKSSRSDQEVYYLAKEMCKMMEKNPDFDPRPYLEGVGLVDADIVRVLNKAIELQKAGRVAKSLPPYLENVRDELMDLLQNGDFDPERAWTEDAKKFLREDKGLTDQEADEVIHDIEEEFDVMTNKSQVKAHKSNAQLKKDEPSGEPLGDVWTLESDDEQLASEMLNNIAQQALRGSRSARRQLEELWDENWESIKEKLETEGSVWAVWWMDGVHEFMRNFLSKHRKSQQMKKDTPYHGLIARDAMVAHEIADELADKGITEGDDWRKEALKLIDEKIKNHEWDLTEEEKNNLLDDILNSIELDLAMMAEEEEENKSISSKSQVRKSSKSAWVNRANALIDKLQRTADTNPNSFHENFGDKEVRDFEEKLNQENTLSYGDKAEIMRMVYDRVDNLAPHYKSQTYKARTIGPHWKAVVRKLVNEAHKKGLEGNTEVGNYVIENIPNEALDTWEGAYGEIEGLAEEYNTEDAFKTQKDISLQHYKEKSSEDDVINNDVTRTIASQLRGVGWSGPIVAWDKNSVKINSGDAGVIISYNEGSDTYTFTPYKGFEMGTPRTNMYADDLPLVVDLINEMKAKGPSQKTAKKSSRRAVQKDDESLATKMKRQELEQFYAGLLKIVRSDPNWQPRVRRILVDNDFENVETIMQWLKEDQHTLAQESSEKSQKNISKRRLADGVEGEIELEAENKVEKPGRSIHSAKFDRCVAHVKASGTAENPYAVCTAVLGDEAFKSQEPEPLNLDKEVERLLLPYIKSFYSLRNIKSLNELSESDLRIFTEMLQKELKRHGVKKVESMIRMGSRFAGFEAEIPEPTQPTKTDEAFKSQNTELSPAEIKLIDQEINKREGKQRLQKDTPTTELPNPLEVGRYEYNGHTIHVWENTQENERYYSVDESPKMFAHEKDARASVTSLKETQKWENGQSHYYAS